jgi:hypothetical protein
VQKTTTGADADVWVLGDAAGGDRRERSVTAMCSILGGNADGASHADITFFVKKTILFGRVGFLRLNYDHEQTLLISAHTLSDTGYADHTVRK